MIDNNRPRDTVLVVDDSPESLSFLTDALEQAGVTVLVALNGRNAISLVDKITPDVVLMDAVMPGMDGFETCRQLKAIPHLSHVPVIFMTGLSETEHVVHGFAAGGVDYVTKPISPDELIARLRVHLSNARLTHGAQAALDASGRFLLAADPTGRIQWCTPQAGRLLAAALGAAPDEAVPDSGDLAGYSLPPATATWLQACVAGRSTPPSPHDLPAGADGRILTLSFVARGGGGQLLLRLSGKGAQQDTERLQQQFGLTAREAEVLLWVARAKSNREIAEILTLSPRTVNKHLEQIYSKLGVENRTAAAALAMRNLDS